MPAAAISAFGSSARAAARGGSRRRAHERLEDVDVGRPERRSASFGAEWRTRSASLGAERLRTQALHSVPPSMRLDEALCSCAQDE